KQMGAIIDADLVIYEKDFQAAVDTAVDQANRDEKNLVDTAEIVEILTPAEEEADHASDGHAEGDGHDHGAIDPHIWLDPFNMEKIADAVTAKLVALDPDQASTYEANATTFKTALAALDASYRTGLATCETREIVTSHAAFAYLANRYGLHQIAIAGIDPSNEPSPAQLADITDHVKRNKITTVFTEELVSPAVAKTVANATGASLATLDPIEGLGKETSDQTYLTLMKRNLTALMKANRCT
ncbi:MAG: zinc transporter substrate-binding protein, partial [Nocardioidaceae bacterium]|nr:zinc transporter substrate-binding protein [Nocardioidaceae bacterium]